MLTAEVLVETQHPARYLAQLGRHAGKMGEHRLHRPRSHAGGGTSPQVADAEWSETAGTVSLSWGRWTMQAFPGTLRLRDLITARLEKIGRRDQLTVRWQATEPR
jgi:hypothetical protein